MNSSSVDESAANGSQQPVLPATPRSAGKKRGGDHLMAWAVVGVTWLSGIAAATYLALNNHPWFGFLVLLFATSAGFRTNDDETKS